jgi:hypothetical protein
MFNRTLSSFEILQLYQNKHCSNDRLQLYYKFENSIGNTLIDYSGNQRTAKLKGTLPGWTNINTHETQDGTFTHACQCAAGYTGETCELITACISNPCQNGGTCKSDGGGSYICSCASGWRGMNCSIVIPICNNQCNSNMCSATATCFDTAPASTCISSNTTLSIVPGSDSSTLLFYRFHDLPSNRSRHNAIVLNNQLYLIGGTTSGNNHDHLITTNNGISYTTKTSTTVAFQVHQFAASVIDSNTVIISGK